MLEPCWGGCGTCEWVGGGGVGVWRVLCWLVTRCGPVS